MKKILYFIPVIVLTLFTSCQKEYDPGATEAGQYAGEWFCEIAEEDGSVFWSYDLAYAYFLDYGLESLVLTYSTADNAANEFWIDDQQWYVEFKAKVTVDGNAESFHTTGPTPNLYGGIDADSVPVAAGVPLQVYAPYGLLEIMDGKILDDAATLWYDMEQSTTDSIYFELVFSEGLFNYTSEQIIYHDTTGVAIDTYYVFKEDADFFTAGDPIDTLIYSGHRQTGWEVNF
jgi:hypothetical protein